MNGWRKYSKMRNKLRFTQRKLERMAQTPKPLGEIIHRLKPVWCANCDAYHVECDYGCCAQTS